MAVANPCLQKDWDEWKEEMEKKRRSGWRQRVKRWSKVRASNDEEEDEDGEEEDDSDWEDEVWEVDDEKEHSGLREGGEMKDEGWRSGGQSGAQMLMKGKEEDLEMVEKVVKAGEDKEKGVAKVGGQEEEVGELEQEVKQGVGECSGKDGEVKVDGKEQEQMDELEGGVKEGMDQDVKEGSDKGEEKVAKDEPPEEELEEGVEERMGQDSSKDQKQVSKVGVTEDKDVARLQKDVKEGMEQEEAQPMKEVLEGGDDEVEREVSGIEEGEPETEAGGTWNVDESEVARQEKAEENDVGREDQVTGEVEEKGEEQELEREGEGEVAGAEKRAREDENELDEEVNEEDGWLLWEDDDQEDSALLAQFQEYLRRIQGQDEQEDVERTMQDKADHQAVSPLGKSDYEGSDLMGYDDDFFRLESPCKDPTPEVPGSIPEPQSSKQRIEKEDRGKKLKNRTVAKSRSSQEESFQDDHMKLQEEEDESTEDEDAGNSTDEEPESYDEDAIKVYSKDDYPAEVFSTLTDFRDSSLLTDLTLSTENGTSFHVHSPVLAAVSSLIRERLRNMWDKIINEEKNDNARLRVSKWSITLGPDVDHIGLEAVVEFAYTGQILFLKEHTVHRIKAAGQAMGVQRVLELCSKEEERSTKTKKQREEDRIPAEEQMRVTLQSLKQLWKDGVGCDVALDAVGGSLRVHRVILAVGSDYFRSMFTLAMKESNQSCVTLPFLLASELEILISCSYSGALPLSWGSIFEITSTAIQLQYQPALSLCLGFLQQEINPHSCLDVVSFAAAYEIVQLLEVADDYVLRQFQKVACTLKFKDLPAKQLLKYLNSHSLCVPSELVVFKAVVAWIQAKPKKRLKLAKELMKTIHFPLMTFKEFKEVQSLNLWSDGRLAELFKAIFEEFCSNDITPQSQCRIYLPKESLVLTGGDRCSENLDRRSVSRELWFGNSLRNHTGIRKAMEWRRLGEMPEPARFGHEVCVLKGKLYVFGGKRYYGTNDTLKSVCRYDPLQNTWESLTDMLQKRDAFSVVLLNGKMLAIGGQCGSYYEDSVEEYCPTANSWRFTWPLDLPLSGHAARVLHGQIYISGGLNSDYRSISSMFLYHPETGSAHLAHMTQPRAYHCMEALGDWLYVAGGLTTDKDMAVVDQLACEVYCPAYDTWTAFTPLPVPHVGAGSAVLEGKFYVLGGYSQEDYSDTKMVHRFDASTQRWENMGKMPGPNNDIRAALLCLPKHFRQ